MTEPSHLRLVTEATDSARRSIATDHLKSGGGGGTLPPMEHRVTRLEEAFTRVDATMERMASDISDVKASQSRLEDRSASIGASQARLEERMERVMDRAREMPTPTIVDGMITSKLGLSALLLAAVGLLIAAITYAVS